MDRETSHNSERTCPTTYFAPAGRAPMEVLQRQEALVYGVPLMRTVMDAMPLPGLIVNEHRQIVAANRNFLGMVRCSAADVLGRRPGEMVSCIHAPLGPDGCGTEIHCMTCGAVNAVLDSQRVRASSTRECRLTVEVAGERGSLDLEVTASTFEVSRQLFTLCALKDISKDKRLGVLNRLFFHDVLNTAGCIRGYADCLADSDNPEKSAKYRAQLANLTEQLLEEVSAHRDLVNAEQGDLSVQLGVVRTLGLLRKLSKRYERFPRGHQRSIRISRVWDGEIVTDGRLLSRVLGNMLVNALEAESEETLVGLSCVEEGTDVQFAVCNPSVMPDEVQLQVFQRSFSTKARVGRGVGTHSMKLIGERYLGGRVSFSSNQSDGTAFVLSLPKKLPL